MKLNHYQKFAKYQWIYRRNMYVGNLRLKLPMNTFPSVIQSVTTDGPLNYGWKSFWIKKKSGRWRGGFGGLFFSDGFKTTTRTVTWPVRRLNCWQTHRGIWNGRSVRRRVYVSIRITDGVSVGETVGKS
jgi:hypothetical protein